MFILRWPGAVADIFVWTVQAMCMSCSFNQNAPISFSFRWYSLNECVYFSEIYWFSACVLSHCFKSHSRLYWYNLNIYNARSNWYVVVIFVGYLIWLFVFIFIQFISKSKMFIAFCCVNYFGCFSAAVAVAYSSFNLLKLFTLTK